jgi:hypothetical protein
LTGALRILSKDAQDHDDDSDTLGCRPDTNYSTEDHPFGDLLAAVTGTARSITEAMSGASEQSRKLRDYLSFAGLVEHTGSKIEGDEIHEAKATFLPLKGVRTLIELTRYPGRKTPEEIRQIYDQASGGWLPPITLRRRQKRKGK